ncbi:hypothetical protein B0189_08130 [Moraxella cuniculi]|nr:hypothetical protein B0189_08130 [Moraxella cuniculi]
MIVVNRAAGWGEIVAVYGFVNVMTVFENLKFGLCGNWAIIGTTDNKAAKRLSMMIFVKITR